jgi:hypothetical protein
MSLKHLTAFLRRYPVHFVRGQPSADMDRELLNNPEFEFMRRFLAEIPTEMEVSFCATFDKEFPDLQEDPLALEPHILNPVPTSAKSWSIHMFSFQPVDRVEIYYLTMWKP